MDYKIQHIPNSKQRRSGKKVNMTTITIHSTANPKSTALNERNWLTNPTNTRTASWHIVVDDKMAVEAIPLNEQAFHAGNSVGNNTSIGIEICESGNRAKTIRNTIELVAKMLYARKWTVNNLRRHYDWSGKNCPNIMSANNWREWHNFKAEIQKELTKLNTPIKPIVAPSKPISVLNITPDVWAVKDWNWAKETGYLDGTRPKDNVTRQEMAVIIRRLVEK